MVYETIEGMFAKRFEEIADQAVELLHRVGARHVVWCHYGLRVQTLWNDLPNNPVVTLPLNGVHMTFGLNAGETEEDMLRRYCGVTRQLTQSA